MEGRAKKEGGGESGEMDRITTIKSDANWLVPLGSTILSDRRLSIRFSRNNIFDYPHRHVDDGTVGCDNKQIKDCLDIQLLPEIVINQWRSIRWVKITYCRPSHLIENIAPWSRPLVLFLQKGRISVWSPTHTRFNTICPLALASELGIIDRCERRNACVMFLDGSHQSG